MGRLEKEHGNKLFNDQLRDGGGCKTNGSVLEFDSQPPHAKVGEDDGSVRCCMPRTLVLGAITKPSTLCAVSSRYTGAKMQRGYSYYD